MFKYPLLPYGFHYNLFLSQAERCLGHPFSQDETHKMAKQKNSSIQEKFAAGQMLGNLLTELESLESI